MILDDLLKLADAQSSTVSVASTSYIDTQAGGDSYEGAWFYFRVDTLFASEGTVTCDIQLQTSANTTFSGARTATYTLVSSSALEFSTFVAGYVYKVRIPPRAQRYIRGHIVVSPNSGANYATSAIYDMFIVKDVDVDRTLA